MRIGTNHGSLSARVMSYWGDSPRGMVESAKEFANICRKHDFHNFVFSMKVCLFSTVLLYVYCHLQMTISVPPPLSLNTPSRRHPSLHAQIHHHLLLLLLLLPFPSSLFYHALPRHRTQWSWCKPTACWPPRCTRSAGTTLCTSE